MDTGEQTGEESSANRRERLLALRSSAAVAASSSPSAAPPPPPPAWDLPEPDLATTSSAPRPRARFDFYTNPGAAFSSSAAVAVPQKRKSADPPGPNPAPAPPHGNYGNNYPPPHQHHMAQSPMEGAPGNSQWRSPMQSQTPMSGYRGTPPGPPPHWNPHSASPAQDPYPRPPNFGFRGPNVGLGGNPMNYGPRGSPMNYGPGGSSGSYVPRGSPHSSSGRGRGENYYHSPGSRGRGGRGGFQNHSGSQDQRNFYRKSMVDDPWQGLQPSVGSILTPINGAKSGLPESLRKMEIPNQGRGDNYYHSPGSRGRGGRGGFQNHSGSQDQRNFYMKSMVDDPWQGLQPIVGSILIPIDGTKSWLPESLRRKKETPNQGRTISNPTSGLSLAEYLASSFNEASNESDET